MSNFKDPREKAKAYMAQHKITELFEELGTQLLYHRPINVREFLVEQLKVVQTAKRTVSPDIETMFGMFDITGKGSITQEQYFQALKNLGIEKPSIPSLQNEFTMSEFTLRANQELRNISSMTRSSS